MSAAGATQPAAMPDGEAPATDDAPDDERPSDVPVPEAREPEAEASGSEAEVPEDADGEPPFDDEPYLDEYDDWDYERQPLSKLAVAALVSGLLALLPLALGFGIAALTVIRRTGRRGYGMALAGIYAAWIWVLIGAAAAALIYFTHGFSPRVHMRYQPTAAYSLVPGDCLNLQNDGSYSIVSCSTSHDAEVYGRLTLSGGVYPGAAAVQQMVVSGCADQLASYVNPQYADIGFSQEYVYPNQQAWKAGERTVICEARFDAGSISGSIKR